MAEFSDERSGEYCMCTREKCSDERRTYRRFHPKPKTNADKIRAMTDEELADWLIMNGNGSDYQTWLDWLKQEVKTNS